MKIDRIIFFGTPQFAVPALDALAKSGKKIDLVVTQPDQPFGRGKKLKSPPVKEYCSEHGLECIQPSSIKTSTFLDQIKKRKADLFVVAAYGRIFPAALLEAAPLVLNVHASLLPRWRGASPISQAILNGDSKTGISIMKLVEKLDAGPVLLKKEISIDPTDDTAMLTQKLAELGRECMIETLRVLEFSKFSFAEQDESLVTYAPLLNVEDAKISWNEPAKKIQQHIRAYGPQPGAFTFDGHERIKIFKSNVSDESTEGSTGSLARGKKILKVRCSDQWLEIVEVQRENKNRQGIVDFLNGYPQERTRWN